MPEPGGPARGPAIGLIVNPIAGLGGRVGLKGTDGADIAARALALGAEPAAPARAAEALVALREAWSTAEPPPRLLTGDGALGRDAARAAGYQMTTLGGPVDRETTADDTRRLAAAMEGEAVDLLLFAGGDGTARDVLAAIDGTTVALGIPAGVKIQSAAFATSPAAAGRLAAAYLASGSRRTAEREVLDLDEDGYRRGEIVPRMHGYLRVPAGPLVQARKAPSPESEATVIAGVAAGVVDGLIPGRCYVLGPGTTVRGIAAALGVPKTLIGIDVIEVIDDAGGTPRRARLLAGDAGEREIRAAISVRPVSIVVTPIGGQGFLFGRGNQPITPAIIRQAGRDGIVVVATPAKLAALGGRPLLVDTGDHDLDRELAGHSSVITGRRDRMVVRIEPA
jgi:predicted polyphosphate/ATP-dependent NAD kinase